MMIRSSDRALSLTEFIFQVFSYLDHSSNSANARVCKQWSEIALDHLWRDITDIQVLFSRISPLKKTRAGWKFHSPPDFDSWTGFSKIGRRVRTLCYDENVQEVLHSSAFDDIARTRTTFNFLPNVHTLEWTGNIDHCIIFMQKNVQHLHIHIPGGLELLQVRNLSQNIAGRMPDLIEIDLRANYSMRDIEDLVTTLFRSLPKLQIVALPLFWLTPNIVESLSSHCYLRMIDFEYGLEQGEGIVDDVANFKPSLSDGAFPRLRDFSFCGSFDETVGFFEMKFAPVGLTTLYIYSPKPETREAFQRSIVTITNSLKSLTSLSLVSLFNPRAPSPSLDACINISDIIPLFAYSDLSHLELAHHFPLKLHQEDVDRIAKAWPKIETLLLNHTPAHAQETPTLSINALLLFALHCPKLRYLGLFMDATALELPKTTSEVHKQPFQSLDKLSVGLSLINDAALAALFLTRICPIDCELNFGYSEVKDTRAQRTITNSNFMEARIQEWEKVMELMPVLMMARMEERSALRNT